jgi:SprT protein
MIDDQIQDKLKDCLQLIVKRRHIYLEEPAIYVVEPLVFVDMLASKRTAGLAKVRDNQIYLNQMYMTTHLDEMIEETLPHELCHILTYKLHGDAAFTRTHRGEVNSHGRLWSKEMMEVFGLFPNRSHIMGQEAIWELKNPIRKK